MFSLDDVIMRLYGRTQIDKIMSLDMGQLVEMITVRRKVGKFWLFPIDDQLT